MNILIINAGSSSIKYQLIDAKNEEILAKGLVERIGIAGSNLKQKAGSKTHEVYKELKDHIEAMQVVLDSLLDVEDGAISSMDEIGAVGHRVVHGGEKFAASVIIDAEVMAAIEDNVALAPLHNPANIMGIQACLQVMPSTPMVAVFDTAFHQTMPPRAFLYGLPYDYYTRLKVRRYGFHGTSHRYVAARAAQFVQKPIDELKIITCHLGNGSSIAAIKNGKCVDTTMGLTPLEGVIMGTRSGDIDPAIHEFLMNKEDLSIGQLMDILNKKSGLLGVSGVSSDMRDITAAAIQGNEQALMALDVFAYRVRKFIGAYAAAMDGVDVIVFTAGVGENDGPFRARIMQDLNYLGAAIDENKNDGTRTDADISKEGSRVRTLVLCTNEELAIARDTLALVKE